MHELSIAEGIAEVVERTAEKNAIDAISSVRVSIGELAGVDTDALLFAWQSVASAGLLKGASLQIERTAGEAWCTDCEKTVPLKAYGDACPACGGYHLIATAGTEMRVIDFVPKEKN